MRAPLLLLGLWSGVVLAQVPAANTVLKPPEKYPHVVDGVPAVPTVAGDGETRAEPSRTFPFTPDVYAKRRAALRGQLKNGIAVVYSAMGDGAAEDESLPRQDSDFEYLTGLEERDAALMLVPQALTDKDILFLNKRDVESERWTGERASLNQDLRVRTGFRRVARMSNLGGWLTGTLHLYPQLHFLGPIVGTEAPLPPALELYGKAQQRVPGVSSDDKTDLIARMREVKDPQEIARIQKATDVTAEGFKAMFARAKAGIHEYELKDLFHETVHHLGARRLSYGSITGSGPNATVLHYPRDDRELKSGELVVADCAAEWENYASDVTRTFPVGGKFTDEQKKIYELVLKAQEAAIAKVKPGARIYEDIDQTARQIISEAGYGDYFIHGVGHFVGLEVHDSGVYNEPLVAGAVITVEPGIYMPGKGIGVRLEDVVLVTPNGHEVLSKNIPKSVAEMEKALSH